MRAAEALRVLNTEVIACRQCPRLVAWREAVALEKRRAYRDCDYWGKPVPSCGDPDARLLLVGLAPGAHGANRTGRMFTGDRSGDFLFRALFETGFANQPTSASRDDGLVLTDCFVTAAVRCVPPDNKPAPAEIRNCRPYLQRELALLTNLKVVVALGAVGCNAYLAALQERGLIAARAPFRFGHGVVHHTHPGGPFLVGCYHPSQQNTSTGKLTAPMLRAVFEHVRVLLG